ncbi:MAG: RsmB/NOP family class I SAM-dependent RNA methyltransferase [Pseudomonadota bacterium]
MTPAARHQAAIEVLETWAAGAEGLDRLLTAWGRRHRFAGSGDRHAIADIAYGAIRRARMLQWLGGGGDAGGALETFRPRIAVLADAVLGGFAPEAIAGAGRHAPPPLEAAEAAALARLSELAGWPGDEGEGRGTAKAGDAVGALLADAPPGVRFNLPDWLIEAHPGLPAAALAALGTRAPVDLRANTLMTTRAAAAAGLAAEGIETVPGPLAADCLRVTAGARRIAGSAAYRDGLVEVQDAASQAVAVRAGARPGQVVLDYCAGGGGKTLALAAAMGGPAPAEGRLLAHDAAPRRMADLAARAARAGARIETVATAALDRLEDACDLVLTDVPCSGSGAWRRNPDARWRFGPADLERLNGEQEAILDNAARLVRPGGQLVYVTCSILESENAARIDAFLARHPSYREVPRSRWQTFPDPALGDGFFVSSLLRET